MEDALDEVRSLARGIYPAPLADRGLVEALRAAALRSALPATVLAAGVGRYPRDIEAAAYFCCLEAMQNAAKHARDATVVVVDLSDDGDLCFEVSDDGSGFDPATVTGGVGFTSMRDRVEAVGGEVTIDSAAGPRYPRARADPAHRGRRLTAHSSSVKETLTSWRSSWRTASA